jgi:hypothetical protein
MSNRGNGAREALIDLVQNRYTAHGDAGHEADVLLAELWVRGFKIVPLDGAEEAALAGDKSE